MAKKIYTVRLVVTNNDGKITAGVAVDTDENKLETVWDYHFAAYLKEVSGEHAEAIIRSCKRLAELHKKLSMCVCDE